MKIARDSVTPFEFEGPVIRDYEKDLDPSWSMAEITAPAGARHRRVRSKRSEKYYFGLQGKLSFTLGDLVVEFAAGDVHIIRRGDRFSYQNDTNEVAKVLLVNTPSFDLSQEVFEDRSTSGTSELRRRPSGHRRNG